MKWLDPSEALLSAWRDAERAAFEGRGRLACPTGDGATLRYFFARHDIDRGGFWMWCPSCGTYEHASASVPDWWVDVDVPADRLTHDPTWLDEHWSEGWLERQPLRS